MKKTVLLVLCLLMAISTTGCTSSEKKEESVTPSYTAGVYTGTATGHNQGELNVEVTLSETAITDIKVLSHTETYGIGYGLATTPIESVPTQIVETQSLAIDTITGATITANSVVLAVTNALESANVDVAALKVANEDSTEVKDERVIDTDVVVIGAGAAGLSAAIEAQNAGANVVILEKQGVTGGATARSGGKLLAAGSTWQQDQGIEDNSDDMHEYLSDIGGVLINQDLLTEFTANALTDLQWLEQLGVKIKDVEPIHSSLTPNRVHNTLGGGGMTSGHGGQITVPLTDTYTNADGEIIYQATANELITNEDGDVVGVKATTKDGQAITVNAKSVIMATGGYASNREMMARYTNSANYVTSVPAGNVGDGLVMGEAVDAQIFDAPGTQTVFLDFYSGVGINEEAGLIVTNDGQRVVNEFTYQYHVAEGLIENNSNGGYYIASANDPYPTVQYATTLDSTLKAESVEELAILMGVDAASLNETITRYNELCDKGSDDDFGKPSEHMNKLEGTLYALKLQPSVTVTFGGLVTDVNAQVLNNSNEVINGLYAAGEVAFTGLFGTEYPCCGMAIGGAVRFGRTAGINAAK